VIWQAGQSDGLVAAGQIALNALRMENGYRVWGTDVNSENDPYEAGLGSAVNTAKSDFVGKAALAARSRKTVARRLRCLTISDGRSVVMGKEPVYENGQRVGYVTSASFGYTIGKPIALAWLSSAIGKGDTVEIEYFERRIAATVAKEPLFDPRRPHAVASAFKPMQIERVPESEFVRARL